MRKNKQINIDLVEIIQNEFNQLPKYEKEKKLQKKVVCQHEIHNFLEIILLVLSRRQGKIFIMKFMNLNYNKNIYKSFNLNK